MLNCVCTCMNASLRHLPTSTTHSHTNNNTHLDEAGVTVGEAWDGLPAQLDQLAKVQRSVAVGVKGLEQLCEQWKPRSV